MRSVGLLLLALALITECRAAFFFRRPEWTLPPGFDVEPFLPGVGPLVPNARQLAVSRNSLLNGPTIVYVGAVTFGVVRQHVTALVDLKGRGEADYATVIVRRLAPVVNGIAWHRGSLYIAALWPDTVARRGLSTIYRLDNVDRFALEKRTATLADLTVVRRGMPSDSQHNWKHIRFGPDEKLYIPIGAPCNVCPLPNATARGYAGWEYGALHRMDPDGSNLVVVARGIRNTVGFDWHPITKRLYFTDNGRDSWDVDPDLTDNRPDCELNVMTKPGVVENYGFPYCHTGAAGGPDFRPYRRLPGVGPNLVDPILNVNQVNMKCNGPNVTFTPAIQAMGPHTAPLGMRFYRWFPGANFPEWFDKLIVIAQHGSWNRQRPIGARLMLAFLNPANPIKVTGFLPFLSGGVPGDRGGKDGPGQPRQPNERYIFRPVDVEQMPDGSLLMSDDVRAGGNVYRISYKSATTCHSVKAEANVEFTLQGVQIPGAAEGCVVNLGTYGTPAFRRCTQVEPVAGSGRWVQLATSLVVMDSQVVLHGALVVKDYACQNGAAGWAALGLPARQSVREMKDGRVFIARPVPFTVTERTGAVVVARKLAGSGPASWTASTGLFRNDTLKSYRSGQALVTTFDMVLPRAWQLMAARAGKIPFPPGGRGQPNPNGLSLMFAMGPYLGGTYAMHWLRGRIAIPFDPADIGAPVPGGQPVLNRGAGPFVPPPVPSPPPVSRVPPPPPPPPATQCPTGAQCCTGGVTYDACVTDSAAGIAFSQYYKLLSGEQLQVAIRAPLDTAANRKWIAWGFNPTNEGRMAGTDAFFAFLSSAGSVVTAQHNLPGYYLGDEPDKVQFAAAGSGTAGGHFWAAFSLAWPSLRTKITVNYGSGAWTIAGGLLKHAVQPPLACVSKMGGTVKVSVGAACS